MERCHFCKINNNLLDLLHECDEFLKDMEEFRITYGKINDELCKGFSFWYWIKDKMTLEMHELPQLKKDI